MWFWNKLSSNFFFRYEISSNFLPCESCFSILRKILGNSSVFHPFVRRRWIHQTLLWVHCHQCFNVATFAAPIPPEVVVSNTSFETSNHQPELVIDSGFSSSDDDDYKSFTSSTIQSWKTRRYICNIHVYFIFLLLLLYVLFYFQ